MFSDDTSYNESILACKFKKSYITPIDTIPVSDLVSNCKPSDCLNTDIIGSGRSSSRSSKNRNDVDVDILALESRTGICDSTLSATFFQSDILQKRKFK